MDLVGLPVLSFPDLNTVEPTSARTAIHGSLYLVINVFPFCLRLELHRNTVTEDRESKK